MLKSEQTKVVGAAALLAAAAMAGCGRAPQAVAHGPAALAARAQSANAPLPTAVGTTWNYKVVAHPANDPYVDEQGTDRWAVEGVTRKGEATTLALRCQDSFTGRFRFPNLVVEAGGVRLEGVSYWGPNPEVIEGFTVPLLRFPMVSGGKWNDGAYFTTVGATEKVSVPAGQFDAVKLSFIGTAPNEERKAKPRSGVRSGGDHYTGVGTLWFAQGVGVVKGEVNDGFWHYESELSSLPARAR